MRKDVRIYVIGLIALFFMSTTGVAVYTHYCNHGGVFYGVFVDVNHSCELDERAEEAHACCTIESFKSDYQFTQECCTSDVDIYHIDTDLISSDLKFDFAMVFTPVFSNLFPIPLADCNRISIANKAPPTLTNMERLSLFQKYLI